MPDVAGCWLPRSLCIVDVLKMRLYKFGPEGGKPEKLEIPANELDKANELHNELVEKAAENDENLMELFFEKGTLNEDELRAGIKAGMMHHELFPVFCVSAIKDMGSGRLMGFIDNVCPAAGELSKEQSLEGDEIVCSPEEEPSLFVFKTFLVKFLNSVRALYTLIAAKTASLNEFILAFPFPANSYAVP